MDPLNERNSANVEFVSQQMLDRLSLQAKQSPRLRKNYNFHASDADICHRLLNAMEPDSYIQPHRHLSIAKDESLVVLRGKVGLIIFADDGSIKETALLEPTGSVMMANIPHGTYHALVSLDGPSVFFEAKAGPFIPVRREEKAPWAPQEGDAPATEYLQSLQRLF
ncbi:MAG: WbuC family cupin fold metalloprotein [Syntrophales bacterium]